MLSISALKSLRIALSYPRHLLAAIAGIAPPRLKDIELKRVEPWHDEALAIARALNLSVHDLIASGDLTDFDYGTRFHSSDLTFWVDGYRLPLSVALRLQHRFGLPSVDDLSPSPLTRELWSALQSNERHPTAAGWCPWCQADIDSGATHAPHCLPHNWLGLRAARERVVAEETLAPPPMRRGRASSSAKVRGLGHLREHIGYTQAEMAALLDLSVNYYARIERGELPLLLAKADSICEQFQISRDHLIGGFPDAPASERAVASQ